MKIALNLGTIKKFYDSLKAFGQTSLYNSWPRLSLEQSAVVSPAFHLLAKRINMPLITISHKQAGENTKHQVQSSCEWRPAKRRVVEAEAADDENTESDNKSETENLSHC